MVIWWHPYVYAEILAAKISHVLYVKVSNDPEAKKIQADTDHHQTGGMCLRINQFKIVCTVDACVASLLATSALCLWSLLP